MVESRLQTMKNRKEVKRNMTYGRFCKYCGIYQPNMKCWHCKKKTVKV